MKTKTIILTAAALVATGIGIVSIAGKRVSLPKKRAAVK
jgi:hypothetical protein